MRIPKTWVPVLASEIMKDLLSREQVELRMPEDQAIARLGEIILEELMVEDRLNAEVRELLKKYDAEIEKGRLDYRQIFDMTKKKIVRERDIIL